MPGNVVKHSTMAPEHESLLARARVPNPQRVVEACRRQALSIWTPGESGQDVVVAAHGCQPPTGICIPNKNSLPSRLEARRGQPRPVGAPGEYHENGKTRVFG